jgi:hypothetical protein
MTTTTETTVDSRPSGRRHGDGGRPHGTGDLKSNSSGPKSIGRKLFDFFSSLRLAVVFLSLACLLVFIGTIAQVQEGLYAAQERYFRSLFIWWQVPGASFKLPVLPGGYLVGGVLLINLIVAYIKRFSFTKKKIGLLIIHIGLVLLFVGQFATDMLSKESAMALFEGETKNYSEDFRANELVLIDKSSTTDKERVHSIPMSMVKENGEIRDSSLPVALRVHKYWHNADLLERGSNAPPMAIPSGATAGNLKDILVIPAPIVTDMDRRNMPAGVVEVIEGGKSHGSFLVSSLIARPERIVINGKQYELAMRFKRYYHPFSITLIKATHEKYVGTEIPKNFASRVRVDNASANEARETVIYMNNPLRYSGLTFFQFQMGADEARMRPGERPSSTFQVVKNPSWLTPYLSCVLVAVGLIIQFAQHLVGFTRRSKTT